MSVIGIIGGAGVAATNKLLELIEIEYTQKGGAYRDCHHPEMIVYQATQVPSRSMFLEGKGETFIPQYVDIACRLKQAGADKICMCCNTAHFAIDEIEQKSNVKFINLIEEVVKEIKKRNVSSIGLVASDGCLKGMVYEKYLKMICPSVKIFYPNTEMQKLVTKGICNTKNIHRFDDELSNNRPRFIFEKISNYLYEQGADIVVMGCTDIRVDYCNSKNIDSLEVLKNTICREAELYLNSFIRSGK